MSKKTTKSYDTDLYISSPYKMDWKIDTTDNGGGWGSMTATKGRLCYQFDVACDAADFDITDCMLNGVAVSQDSVPDDLWPLLNDAASKISEVTND